jgi:hypothetical protein
MVASSQSASSLVELATYLAGEFDNQPQALADPTWYVHLKVWNRPLPPGTFEEGYGFFIEQIGVAGGKPPYRQRILHLTHGQDGLRGQYYGLLDPLKFRGSGTQPERLASLTADDLVHLPTCCLAIKSSGSPDRFAGRLPANSLCSITYEGKTSYISLGFDIGPAAPSAGSPIEYLVYDRGVNPETGKTTWGPMMGPFRLIKQAEFPLVF